MKKLVAAGLLSFLFATSVNTFGVAPQTQPSRTILGVKVGMNGEAAREELKKVGRLERKERKKQEVWVITNDQKYSGVIIGFEVGLDKAERVRFVTATARPGAVRYSDVGNIKKARQVGATAIKNFRYEWDRAAEGREPKIIVQASGRDRQYLTTHSIKWVN